MNVRWLSMGRGPVTGSLTTCFAIVLVISGPPTAPGRVSAKAPIERQAASATVSPAPMAEASPVPPPAPPVVNPPVQRAPVATARASHSVPAAAPPAPPPFNRLAVPALGIRVGLVDVSGCGFAAAVPHTGAARMQCLSSPGEVYIAGHNPGPFSPLARAQAGESIQYWDAAGVLVNYTIRVVEKISVNNDAEALSGPRPQIILQTCATADGSMIWVIKASPS
ncbi:MAG TPA: hypothetical protein VG329_10585 [Candidatus Dormibacteraeota bacterium]|jgi:hypothetical protein|nr:hypothetical protein [Candidatus Dormibacteraeota bacterium]